MWCREPFMEELNEIEALNDIENEVFLLLTIAYMYIASYTASYCFTSQYIHTQL